MMIIYQTKKGKILYKVFLTDSEDADLCHKIKNSYEFTFNEICNMEYDPYADDDLPEDISQEDYNKLQTWDENIAKLIDCLQHIISKKDEKIVFYPSCDDMPLEDVLELGDEVIGLRDWDSVEVSDEKE